MLSAPPKVVYIAGWGRSGSTILDQILGQIDGWFSCGELNLMWWSDAGCGCGASVSECEFWGPVATGVLDRHPGWAPEDLVSFREWLGTSAWSLPAIAREARAKGRQDSPVRRHAELLRDLYGSIAASAGARVLVDSSKMAAYAYLISALTDVELYVVHLVRDPRAAAYSWGRVKLKSYDPPMYFGRLSPARSSILWLRRNAIIEATLSRSRRSRYMRLRYEDFVDDPEGSVRAICALAGDGDAELPFLDGHRVRLAPNHTVAGNPTRFTSGELEIRQDEEWKQRLDRRGGVLATLPAAPLMPHYGYPLLSRR